VNRRSERKGSSLSGRGHRLAVNTHVSAFRLRPRKGLRRDVPVSVAEAFHSLPQFRAVPPPIRPRSVDHDVDAFVWIPLHSVTHLAPTASPG
jgi:hypothetical protein